MNRLERFSQWRGRNVLPIDIIGTLAIAFFAVGVAASTGDTPGILFAHDATSQIIWSLVSLVPVMFRRWRPQAAALCYAGLVALHLIFGIRIERERIESRPCRNAPVTGKGV